MVEPILQMKNISKTFHSGNGITHALSDVSIVVYPNETLGIVGESGSGKSTLAKILTRLYSLDGGTIVFHGNDVTHLSGNALREERKHIQMVFQDPTTAFDPKMRVRDIICEPLYNYGLIKSKKEAEEKAKEMLRLVELPEEFASRYPNDMSGGQRQRVGIARALVLRPEIIILDEATSALDVSVQKKMIELLKKLQNETGVSYLFICHDLVLANSFCHRMVVMQHGKIVEEIKELKDGKEEYTKHLIESIFPVD